jgi:hypothetical protein
VGEKGRISGIFIQMKSKILAFVCLAGTLAGAAGAQNQPDQEKKEPLSFAKIAANVAGNVQHRTVNGTLAIYVSEQNWAAGLKDGDLGPFLKLKEAKPGRSAACLFSQSKDIAVCVYFDGNTPFGVTAVEAGASGKLEASDIAAAYKPVSKDMLKKGAEELSFTPVGINTDDGQALPAFLVTAAGK